MFNFPGQHPLDYLMDLKQTVPSAWSLGIVWTRPRTQNLHSLYSLLDSNDSIHTPCLSGGRRSFFMTGPVYSQPNKPESPQQHLVAPAPATDLQGPVQQLGIGRII